MDLGLKDVKERVWGISLLTEWLKFEINKKSSISGNNRFLVALGKKFLIANLSLLDSSDGLRETT